MNIPNLFIVGAPKCGTTSLYYYLSQHPDVFMASPKEPHVFSSDIEGSNHYGVESMAEYLRLFEASTLDINGEASVWYLYSKVAAKKIREYSPQAKIVVAMRDPLLMIPSLHRQFLASLNEDEPALDRAIALQAQRSNGASIPRACHLPLGLQYERIAQYDRGIEEYLNIFGEDQVHFVLAEELSTDPVAEIDRLFDFLQIDRVKVDLAEQNRSDRKVVYPQRVRELIKRQPQLVNRLASLSPSFVRRAVKRTGSVGGVGQIQWSGDTRRDVAGRLEASVARVRSLTNLPLERWLLDEDEASVEAEHG